MRTPWRSIWAAWRHTRREGEEEAARGSGIPGKSRPGHGRHRGADRGDPAHLSAARPRSPACRPADTRDDRGTRFEATQTEDDGTLRVVGHDTGAGVSDVFGTAITSYEWVYVVPSGRVNALARALSAEPGDDVMDALAGYYHSTAAGSALPGLPLGRLGSWRTG